MIWSTYIRRMHLSCGVAILFFTVHLVAYKVSAREIKIARIAIQRHGLSLELTANLGKKSHRISIPQNLDSDLRALYADLETKKFDERSDYLAKRAGKLLLSPLEPILSGADEINFVISDDMVSLPLDLLYFRGAPLFVQKPVTFDLSSVTKVKRALPRPWSVIAFRDVTADPEDGVGYLRGLSRKYILHAPGTVSQASGIDVLIVSAHGTVGRSTGDYLTVDHQKITAGDLSKFSPRLVYLDSCRLGVSLEFLRSFERAGTFYYVAPILSNEAGQSSTRTIQIFFDNLAMGKRPSEALYATRRDLFKEFEREPRAWRLWRSFPFRIYRLR